MKSKLKSKYTLCQSLSKTQAFSRLTSILFSFTNLGSVLVKYFFSEDASYVKFERSKIIKDSRKKKKVDFKRNRQRCWREEHVHGIKRKNGEKQ